MSTDVQPPISVVRHVFPAWSIHIPPSFDETFLTEPDYWHAWDEDRSVSLSSVVVDDGRGPAPAGQLVDQMPRPHEGTPVDVLPAGLLGWAVVAEADPTSRATRALSGILAVDGRLLLAPITSDDPAWIRSTWLSIRYHETPIALVRPAVDSLT